MNFHSASTAISKRLSHYGFSGRLEHLSTILFEVTGIDTRRTDSIIWGTEDFTQREIYMLSRDFLVNRQLLSCLAVPTSPEVISESLDRHGQFRTYDCEECCEAIDMETPLEQCFHLISHVCCVERSEFVKTLGPKLSSLVCAFQDFGALSIETAAMITGLEVDEAVLLKEMLDENIDVMTYHADQNRYSIDLDLI